MASDAALSPFRVVNIEDLRRLARRRLPRVVFDYLDGAAEVRLLFEKTSEPSRTFI